MENTALPRRAEARVATPERSHVAAACLGDMPKAGGPHEDLIKVSSRAPVSSRRSGDRRGLLWMFVGADCQRSRPARVRLRERPDDLRLWGVYARHRPV